MDTQRGYLGYILIGSLGVTAGFIITSLIVTRIERLRSERTAS